MKTIIFTTLLSLFFVSSCSNSDNGASSINDDNSQPIATTIADGYMSFSQEIQSASQASFRVPMVKRASQSYQFSDLHSLRYTAAGKKVIISYQRKPEYIGQTGNLSELILFYRFANDSAVHSIKGELIPGPESARFTIETPSDKGGLMEVWFKAKTSNGSEYYDSNYGKNYGFFLIPPTCAQIVFPKIDDPANWPKVEVRGRIKSGGSLCIEYQLSRLYELGLRDTHYRGLTIKPSFVSYIRYFDADGNDINDGVFYMRSNQAALPIPENVKKVSVWFKGSEYSGRSRWDSNFGKNYTFDVE